MELLDFEIRENIQRWERPKYPTAIAPKKIIFTTVCRSILNRYDVKLVKGTLMQIWKSPYMFVFI